VRSPAASARSSPVAIRPGAGQPGPADGRGQAFFMGRPQQIFCTIATFPHFTQR
jgi:hypothetical protein